MDICCGTGSIGIALADRFDKVYGIEMIQSAIDDANMNIKKNNLENCIFECGKAENRMRDISIEVSKVNSYVVFSRAFFHLFFQALLENQIFGP